MLKCNVNVKRIGLLVFFVNWNVYWKEHLPRSLLLLFTFHIPFSSILIIWYKSRELSLYVNISS
jgi:hypothetical protein